MNSSTQDPGVVVIKWNIILKMIVNNLLLAFNIFSKVISKF